MRSWRAFAGTSALLVAVVAAATGPWAAADEHEMPGDLATLIAHFAKSRGIEAEFREEKRLPLLVEPLVSEGVLYYAPPGRLARFTTDPEQATLLVDGDRLRIEDGLGVEEVDLAAHDSARLFIDQLLVLFRGDLVALERDYKARFEARGEAWSLTLEPRSLVMRQVIQLISLRGRARQLDEMLVLGAEGETTRTTYARIDPDRRFADEELARLFPVEGSPLALEPPGVPEAPGLESSRAPATSNAP